MTYPSRSPGQQATHALSGDEDGAKLEPLPLTVVLGPMLGALMFTDDDELAKAAAQKASLVRDMIEKQGWSIQLRKNQPKYVKCEGWVALAAMCGMAPTIIGTSELESGARAAIAELRDCTGRQLVRADAECGDKLDGRWATEPGYSKRSMAQTRAIAKCCRASLSWVMSLAGYSPTPAEEVMGRDFAEDTGLSSRLKACVAVMRREHRSMSALFDALSDHSGDSLPDAATAWFELDAESKMALWVAPSDGGPFTTEERAMMKSSDFRKLYYGESDATDNADT